MDKGPIKLSIITINLNNRIGLELTINSVISQNSKGIEYIIIDGGSTDGSVDVVKKHLDYISIFHSEKDDGIYAAMNKGIKKASGLYCFFLNSGDSFYNENVLTEIDCEVLHGDIINFSAIVKEGHAETLVNCKPDITFFDFYRHTILHQATFIKRTLFLKFGFYNETFKIVSDWEFFIKALFINNCSYQPIPLLISRFSADGISSQPESVIISFQERQQVLEKYFGRFLPDYKLLALSKTYRYLILVNKYYLLRKLFILKIKIMTKLFKQLAD